MKTRIGIVALILALALLAGCASTQTFESVYTGFKRDLNLDGAKSYTVVEGDTLAAITISFYGEENGFYFPLIMGASSDVVAHPDKIAPGMALTVPDYDKNIKDPIYAKKVKPWFVKVSGIYRKEGQIDVADRILGIANGL